jgi:hypothetical protein
VCSVQRIEVVLMSRRNLRCRNRGIIVDCIANCDGHLVYTVQGGSGTGAV